mmetsp:Transcript_12540/g.26706  ORF Transcript_12540/g.26706 Transcript_12540/m.26706 type:complete len:422 (+) Transcript_12540:264-1529(+)|eukprot:CAMPEP_0183738086 /NCGR_PEP_ID=MMETSP0737-20130205/53719_1 /TAXON_ID=385413 /ORGANISM="Thalassiosira miniscula, Strain CCMP1093" /LENGTH=421 /DNA_ID=CAMNT_0025972533 /DNA_START=158 /DNA_END=1423 /DNA_ORIENTATION=-
MANTNTLRARESRPSASNEKTNEKMSARLAKNSLHPSESISAVDIGALPSAPNSMSIDANALPSSETKPLVPGTDKEKENEYGSGITATGLKVLILLAIQNSSKNLLLRFVMKEHPKFLKSAAIIGVETVKLVLSLLYIILVDRKPAMSAVTFIRQDKKNTILMAVPATLYSIQMFLEYVALGNIDAAVFSVLVQTKLLATAGCAVFILGKRIKKVQLISLILLTIGVMLCNMKNYGTDADQDSAGGDTRKGILATLGISSCSGFAGVYTEKVIKAKRNINSGSNSQLPTQQPQVQSPKYQYGLAYTQVQLAFVSLVIMGFFCMSTELDVIMEKGFLYGFNVPACISILVGAIGGLIVAAVLKFADAVLKGYATAVSVILTGVFSMILFGTQLNALYFLGIGNVVCAVFLYSAKDLDRLLC